MVRPFDLRLFVDAEAEGRRVAPALNIFLIFLAADASCCCTLRLFDARVFLDTEAAATRFLACFLGADAEAAAARFLGADAEGRMVPALNIFFIFVAAVACTLRLFDA